MPAEENMYMIGRDELPVVRRLSSRIKAGQEKKSQICDKFELVKSL